MLNTGIPFAMGEMLPTLIGGFVKDWSMFQLIVSIFMLATCFSWFLLPESPRYLISKGKVAEVTKVLESAAKRNGVTLSAEVMAVKKEVEGEQKKEEKVLEVYGLMDMFRGSQIKITIAFFITWPVITLLYYGNRNIYFRGQFTQGHHYSRRRRRNRLLKC